MRSKIKLFTISIIIALSLSGCVTTLPVNYAPSSTMTVTGTVGVTDFSYLPATSGKVKPNQIRNTAMGNAYFEQNIDSLVRDAVFKEMRFVGINVNNQERKLSGVIEEFLIDDLGYSVDWTLRIKYKIIDASGTTYESTKEIKRKTNKFANIFGALNETIKLNVEEALKDPAFISAIH
jgi:uncharacterized lipoprotein